ncbi:MAG: ATP-grasp domain-containing protein [Lentimicrobiaceae bacterium]|nr:ATP-grasp domain-containing protein [Lentimicrobiaceae bacterium]
MKKLLILGSSNHEVDVIKIAQSMGYYVITTDYYTDKNLIPSKFVADEAWNISWTDYDELEARCRETGVNGILAGFSEFRIEAMIELCRRLNLPCYINDEQLEITRDKNKFKQMCKRFGVPIVNEYDPQSLEIIFPVIIKPTDRGGSIGINVAYNENEYKEYLEYAYSMSPSKSVVVEDFIGDGIKFDCSYYISEKEAVLIETCDTTMLTKQKGFETMQKAWTFPSKHEQEYIEQVDTNVKSMLMSLGMKCGVANISFFYRNGRFYVFETGFRLGGGHSFDYQRASNGIDYLSCMIKYALNEDYEPNTNIPRDRGFAVTYNIYFNSNEGVVVNHVIGEDKVRDINEVITYVPNLYNGYVIKGNKPNSIAMCTLYAKDLDTILRDIDIINKTLKVETNSGICPIFCELTSCEILDAISK